MKEEKLIKYKDVTKEWLKNAKPNSNKIIIDNYYMTDDGVRHPIKGQEKICPPKKESDEYKIAKIIMKTLGGDLHLIPRIETEKGYKGIVKVPTPDYRWNKDK